MSLIRISGSLIIRRGFCSALPLTSTHTTPRHTAKRQPLISCKNKEFNLWHSTTNNQEKKDKSDGFPPLASKGWMHRKAKGDHFVLNPVMPTSPQCPTPSFSSLGLNPDIEDRVLRQGMGIEAPTPFQAQALPLLLRHDHTVLAAETGCGKTLAYLLPILQNLSVLRAQEKGRRFNTPLALVLTPGRELAAQVGQVAQALGLQTKTVVGGHTKRLLLNPSFDDVDVLVGTVGALSKLVTHGIYRMERVRHVVLDEADTLLDDSFSEKLGYFLRRFPFHRHHQLLSADVVGTQLVLVSATLPRDYEELLRPLLHVSGVQLVASPELHRLQRRVTQRFVRMSKEERSSHLLRLVKADQAAGRPVVVFSNRTPSADFVSLLLNDAGVDCLNLTGDMHVAIREGRFARFQAGQCAVLSTTDVGSRGLDTSCVAHVVNFDFPLHVADYIHRCGRVGRVGSRVQDALITNFVSSGREIELVQKIEHAARTDHQLRDVNANITGIIRQRMMKSVGDATGRAAEEDEEKDR